MGTFLTYTNIYDEIIFTCKIDLYYTMLILNLEFNRKVTIFFFCIILGWAVYSIWTGFFAPARCCCSVDDDLRLQGEISWKPRNSCHRSPSLAVVVKTAKFFWEFLNLLHVWISRIYVNLKEAAAARPGMVHCSRFVPKSG